MKTFLLFFLALNAEASWVNWPDLTTVYSTNANCLSANPQGDCLAIPEGAIGAVLEKVAEMTDDLNSPQWEAASQVTACVGQEACQTALEELICSSGEHQKFIDAEFTQVYCTKILGYDQVATGRFILQENADQKAAYLAVQAAIDAQESALKEVQRRRNAGQRVISLVILRNSVKNLTDEQVVQLHSTYATIKAFLEDGSLDRAKAAVEATIPDGIVMTSADKDAIIEEINNHL